MESNRRRAVGPRCARRRADRGVVTA